VPADDIPGRIIGISIGEDAFNLANNIFEEPLTAVYNEEVTTPVKTYPNPALRGQEITLEFPADPQGRELRIYDVNGRTVGALQAPSRTVFVPTAALAKGIYFIKSEDGSLSSVFQLW